MLATVDFETEAIQDRPHYPPEPVGVAIRHSNGEEEYLAWGHPTENNCTKAEAQEKLLRVWRDYDLLFFNGKFDYEVGVAKLGMPEKHWSGIHDAMFSVFMHDPHARELGLKPSSERILGLPPEEQEDVRQWLVAHGICTAADKKWGRFICKAPGGLVGKYAIGDVRRTYLLHEALTLKHDEHETKAYDRERRLMPILLRNEQEGMRIDTSRLEEDLTIYESALVAVTDWIRERLHTPELDLGKSAELAAALSRNDLVSSWKLTKKHEEQRKALGLSVEDYLAQSGGKGRSTSKKNLTLDQVSDQDLVQALGYYNRVGTALKMSMRPWKVMADATGGFIFTSWNQVRQTDGADMGGTRTGRLSCPYFMNITKDWNKDGSWPGHPEWMTGFPELPMVRRYILPDEGGVFLHRDYSQQEFRILAHFEDDKLLHAYRENPQLDFHDYMGKEITRITHHELRRGPVKILNFGILYGMGTEKLARATGTWDPSRCLPDCTHENQYNGSCHAGDTAKEIKGAQRHALPGLRSLEDTLSRRGKMGESIRTWGGRYYHAEPPVFIGGRRRTFEYKLLNYLIQGSAADCTKEAVIRYNDARKDGRFLVTVHDEINISAPAEHAASEMKILKDVMESIEFDVPMLSDGKTGPSWGELSKENK